MATLGGSNAGFLELRLRTTFTFNLLRPDRAPRHKKKLEWRISKYPDASVGYELEGQQLTRTVKINGKPKKTKTSVDAANGDFFTVKLGLEAHKAVLKSKNGAILDEFTDDQHDWSQAVVAIKGDQVFTVEK